MSQIPNPMPPRDPQPPPKSSSSAGMIVLILAVVGVLSMCVVIPILMALILPAVQKAREAARRSVDMNNMRQISIALDMYVNTHNAYPPPYVTDADGKPLYSWRVLILPYLDQDALYSRYKLDEAWDSPNNKPLSDTVIKIFQNPAEENLVEPLTNYVVVQGKETMFPPDGKMTYGNIKDGTANTIMVVEISGSDIHWAEPRDLDFNTMSFDINDFSGQGISSTFSGGAHVTFADGSVHLLPVGTDPNQVKAAITASGGEAVMLPY